MKEFAQKGYANASTDTIVKEAGISKGSLFYYFKNKKKLFFFLYDYALGVLKKEILMKFNYEERDIFDRIQQSSILKMEVLKKHPEMYNFIGTAYMEDSSEVKDELENINKEIISSSYERLYENIDISKFKKDVDVKRAIEIITWTIDGFSKKELVKIKKVSLEEINYDELFKELDIYFNILKKSFYK